MCLFEEIFSYAVDMRNISNAHIWHFPCSIQTLCG